VPVGHITNGVHVRTWLAPAMQDLYNRHIGHDWREHLSEPQMWARIDNVADGELWETHRVLKAALVEFVLRKVTEQRQRAGYPEELIKAGASALDPEALTIGFARRFATYKRAPLIFQQFENIVKLTRDKARPIQFIFAGKAHPRDDDGKRYIQHIIHLSKYSDLQGHLIFIENYDMHVARQMVSGCDVWLNNPRRPLEASGTSGMKAGCHGCLNLSIMDGWWREGYDGTNGFAIGEDTHAESVEEQDRTDSANLYKVLTQQVIPLFFDRDEQGTPRKWIQRIRRAMVTLVPQFTTDRMVREYAEKYYLPKEPDRLAP